MRLKVNYYSESRTWIKTADMFQSMAYIVRKCTS